MHPRLELAEQRDAARRVVEQRGDPGGVAAPLAGAVQRLPPKA